MSIHDAGELVFVEHGPGEPYLVPAQCVADHGTAAAFAEALEAAGAGRASAVHLITDDHGTPLYAATTAALGEMMQRPPSSVDEATLLGWCPPALAELRMLGAGALHADTVQAARQLYAEGRLGWHPDDANSNSVRPYLTGAPDGSAAGGTVHAGPGGGEAA